MLTHMENKLYRCEECKMTFARGDYLAVHKRTHTGEKPFACTGCEMTFSAPCSRNRHMKIHVRDAKRDMAPVEDHYVLETHHTVQSWETKN